jgi:hypothetical protein
MMDLPKWVSRTAALSLLVFVIGALYLLVVSPVIEAHRGTDEATQEDVGAKIEKNGGKLRSIQILPVKTDGDFKRVSVRVQLTATLGSFARILYALESGKPYVFIDNLDVKNRRGRKAKQKEEEDPELVIRFDLYGYLRPELG